MHADRALAIVVAMLGATLVIVSWFRHLNQEFLGLALIIASAAYLLLDIGKAIGQDTKKFSKLSILALAFSIIGTIFTYALANSFLYHRPIWAFVSWALFGGLLAAGCWNLPSRFHGLSLLAIATVSTTISASVYYKFGGFYGVDPWFHSGFTELLLEQGGVPPGTAYSFFPGLHLFVASLQISTGLETKAAFFALLALHNVAIVVVYLMTKEILGPKVGIMSAFLVGLSNYFIYWGFWITSTTFGVTLFSILLLCFVRVNKGHTKFVVPFGVIATALVVSHALSSFVALAVLTISAAATSMGTGWSSFSSRSSRRLVAFFAVLLLGRWLFAYYAGQSLISWAATTVLRSLGDDLGNAETVTRSSVNPPLLSLLDNFGYAILIALIVLGALILFSKTKRKSWNWIAIGALPFAIAYGGGVLGIAAILPHRWIIFGILTAAPLAGLAWQQTICQLKGHKQTVVTLLAASILVGAMITNSWANSDSPVWDLPSQNRYGFMDSELAPVSFVTENVKEIVRTDFWYSVAPLQGRSVPLKAIDQLEGNVLLRDYITERALTIPVAGGFYVTDSLDVSTEQLDVAILSKNSIYSSGTTVLISDIGN